MYGVMFSAKRPTRNLYLSWNSFTYRSVHGNIVIIGHYLSVICVCCLMSPLSHSTCLALSPPSSLYLGTVPFPVTHPSAHRSDPDVFPTLHSLCLAASLCQVAPLVSIYTSFSVSHPFSSHPSLLFIFTFLSTTS